MFWILQSNHQGGELYDMGIRAQFVRDLPIFEEFCFDHVGFRSQFLFNLFSLYGYVHNKHIPITW